MRILYKNYIFGLVTGRIDSVLVLISLLLLTNTVVSASTLVVSKIDLNYYLDQPLNKNNRYNPSIIKPQETLKFEVGQWHARHDQIIEYMRTLATQSERVSIIEMGRTWEQRPQILVVITSKENQANLNELIKQRALSSKRKLSDQHLVVWLGYSVHGNEASGSNASMISAYHLAALEGVEHEQFLRDSIVVIEPSLNPDGYGRFSNWANNNRSTNLSTDVFDREHREDWPGGRTNHYRFDLNRDWLLAQQIESQSRLKWFHKFRPVVVGDYHEMGSNNSYFFQPGVVSRQNPLTPDENFDLTQAIAKHHAKVLDAAGSLYYSKESYDDYYYGKGSTYPDINGSIGILFEQASVRGHLKNTINGPMSFAFAIKNHFMTSLSILEGAYANKDKLLAYQQNFYEQSKQMAANDNTKAMVVSDDGDRERLAALTELLLRHQIKVYKLANKISLKDKIFKKGIIIPFNQPQYRLIKALFETRTQFKDNTFYDVSTWTLPLAFNLPFESLNRKALTKKLLGEEIKEVVRKSGTVEAKSNIAYSIDWKDFNAAPATNVLLNMGVNLRVATKAFQGKSTGTIVIPVGIQKMTSEKLYLNLKAIAKRYHIDIGIVESGFSIASIDLGSPSMRHLAPIRPIMLTGSGVSAYDSGEIWHLLDQRLSMSLTQAKLADFSRLSLKQYTHLILVDGNYDFLNDKEIIRIKNWIDDGGILIAMKSAVKWVAENKIADVSFVNEDEDEKNPLPVLAGRAYSTMDSDDAEQVIGGSIFSTKLDLSHPLAYGYSRQELPVFRNHELIMNPSTNQYATVARYQNQPLVSGFVSNENLEKISDSAAVIALNKSKGSVILILDNPVFRGYWYGTSRLLINSLFFGSVF